jgi:micrococcal nuclease
MALTWKSSPFVRAVVFVGAALGVLIAVVILPNTQRSRDQGSKYFRVIHVYDGDTFKIESGEKVRLLGIDTPEMHESNKLLRDAARSGDDIETIKALGRRAYEFVHPKIDQQSVRLEFDIEQRDKYGRLLAYVYLEDGTFLNKLIIENGYAVPLTIPPDVRYADLFKALYKEARAKHLGLWQ